MRWFIIIQLILISLFSISLGCKSISRPGALSDNLLGLRKDDKRSEDLDEFIDPMGRRSVNRIMLEDLLPSQIVTTIQSRFSSADSDSAAKLYNEAQDAYRQAVETLEADPKGKKHENLFEKAAKKFQLAGAKDPESSTEEDALFYEGESYFFANRYVQSNRAYEKLISLYSGSRYLDKAERNRFAIAEYWLQLAEKYNGVTFGDTRRPSTNLTSEAQRIFHRIRLDDPTGKLADDATMALGMAYFTSERYFEAADTLEDLRIHYPGSQHQFHAHLYELKARLQSYRGSSYDETPLIKADKILKTIVTQFPEQANSEKEYLALEATRIRNLLADRDLAMAKYFERRGENRAARFYLEQVAENYGDTQIALDVDQQIAELADKPPLPPQHGEWLVNLFPDPDREKPALTAAIKEKLIR